MQVCNNLKKERRNHLFVLLTQAFTFILLLLGTVSAQDWTCDECAEGGAAVGAFASSEDAIAAQVEVLLEYVCPQAPEELACQENLPSFCPR